MLQGLNIRSISPRVFLAGWGLWLTNRPAPSSPRAQLISSTNSHNEQHQQTTQHHRYQQLQQLQQTTRHRHHHQQQQQKHYTNTTATTATTATNTSDTNTTTTATTANTAGRDFGLLLHTERADPYAISAIALYRASISERYRPTLLARCRPWSTNHPALSSLHLQITLRATNTSTNTSTNTKRHKNTNIANNANPTPTMPTPLPTTTAPKTGSEPHFYTNLAILRSELLSITGC